MDLLSPDGGTIFWTIITFILLLLILKKYAWKPLLDSLEKRENQIRTALDEAEKNKTDAEKLLEQQKQLLEKARDESAEFLVQSKNNAEQMKKEIVVQAHKEAERIIGIAKHEIELQKESALNELKQYTVDIAFLAAQKVIGDFLDREKHIKLIDQQIKKLNVTHAK